MLGAMRVLTEAAVLGMNRRNADYVMRCNPRSAFPLVDDKVRTKTLAERHQVPTPPLYRVIHSVGDLRGLDGRLREYREFVVKPARGAGGSGILLVIGCEGEGFVKSSGQAAPWEDVAFHITNILSGIYSLGGTPDQAIVEGLIHPDPVFDAVSYRGVPDIRLVVYRGVPVMGMVRLPTKASDGKANLHRGAIGAGIDIANGRSLMAVHRSRVITHHPDTGNPVMGFPIPHWDQMLSMAAKMWDMVGLGYLGVDLILDRDRGPLMLELNTRPGLAIQLANRAGLWGRLSLVDRAPAQIFADPGSRVAWAKETFQPRQT